MCYNAPAMPIPHTIAASLVVEGIALHTGVAARVEIHPAPVGHGRVFLRQGVEISALAGYVVDTQRRVTLGNDGVTVATVEHLLAALALAEVDNVEIIVDGPELPALDGSAHPWLSAITAAGVCPQEGEIPSIRIPAARWIEEGDTQFFLCPADALILYAAVSIPDTAVQRMMVGGPVQAPEVREQIVRARTYGLQQEVQALFEKGLARGGSLDNAVILTEDGYLNDHVWPDEPAWHKIQDLVGDLALLGLRVTGQILAVRGGHRSHLALVNYLRQFAP
ncbi:MAG: UDP-3-O-acyl-N-acetylglucosamine deacetylase [Armatimonadota bacterium]